MREADFEVLLRLVERLSDEQRGALGRALASASGEPEAVRLLEDIVQGDREQVILLDNEEHDHGLRGHLSGATRPLTEWAKGKSIRDFQALAPMNASTSATW